MERSSPGDQILILDPAMHTPENDCFNLLALMSPLPCTYHLPALQGLASLDEVVPESIKGIVIFGSGCSVHERLLWQSPFEEWLRPYLLQGIPTLGICYGHQMVAHMFGGEVGYVYENQDKLLGFRTVRLHAAGPFKEGTGALCVSHNETVTKVPDGFSVFAESPIIPTDGLCHNELPIWTLQSHPEATRQFLLNQNIPLPKNAADYLFGHQIMAAFLEYAATYHRH